MEDPLSSLTYKGSISDAIVEARRQRKLLLVHVSGEDEDSTLLKQSTWGDKNVAETISKCGIFLHLVQGGIEALQFSAIYPQKSVPSITAVGYNGSMLWQHEGYVSVEIFVEAIEKAWASLHFQETAATLLTAALASKNPEHLNSSSPDVAQVSSSASDVASTSAGEHLPGLEDRASIDSVLSVKQMDSGPVDDKETRPCQETSSQSDQASDVKMPREEQIISACNTNEEVLLSTARDMHDSTCAGAEKVKVDGSHTVTSLVSPGKTKTCAPGSLKATATEIEKSGTEERNGPTDSSYVIKSDDIHLNIRFPNGSSLQRKFTLTDTLRSVKDYVNENKTSEIVSYDLAVPYPRKVFSEQDMNTLLSELGFAGRQALIVVPHHQASRPQRGQSSSNDSQSAARMIDSNDDNGGYFGIVRRAFSFMNPLSYLSGSANLSNSEPAQHSSDSAVQRHHLPGAEASQQSYGRNHQNPSGGNNVGETRRTSRPFGSNIHTLRHDEDDFSSRDRNTFWNGNSTEFGGDDKK